MSLRVLRAVSPPCRVGQKWGQSCLFQEDFRQGNRMRSEQWRRSAVRHALPMRQAGSRKNLPARKGRGEYGAAFVARFRGERSLMRQYELVGYIKAEPEIL